MTASIGFTNGVFNARMEKAGGHRLGISYSSSVLSVIGANGNAFSQNNPGYSSVWSGTAGQIKTYNVTSPQSFEDASGTSVLTGNLFGLTTGVATSVDVPFFLYGCTNDAEDTLTFGISRIPHIKVAPAVADLGNPSTSTADTEYSMFLLDDVSLGDYDGNPVVLLGSFRMRMDASDDWTVQALDDQDGIGRFNDSRVFTGMAGQFGADSGTYTYANSGTSPQFNVNTQQYQIFPNGICYCHTALREDAGTDGAGAVEARTQVPFLVQNLIPNIGGQFICQSVIYRNAGADEMSSAQGLATTHQVRYARAATTTNDYYEWQDFGNGQRQIAWSGYYRVRNA